MKYNVYYTIITKKNMALKRCMLQSYYQHWSVEVGLLPTWPEKAKEATTFFLIIKIEIYRWLPPIWDIKGNKRKIWLWAWRKEKAHGHKQMSALPFVDRLWSKHLFVAMCLSFSSRPPGIFCVYLLLYDHIMAYTKCVPHRRLITLIIWHLY